MRRNLSLTLGGGLLTIIVVTALLAPLIAPYRPDVIDLGSRLLAPSAAHLAGTDEVGRDLFSRILFGLRASLAAGVGIVAAASVIGTLIGCFSGYVGGWVDAVIMRLMDMVLSLPGLVVAMALTAALGPSLLNAVLALAVLAIPYYARVARGAALEVSRRAFVQASKVMGASLGRQLFVNVIPNVLPQVLVVTSLHVGAAMLAVAGLSFIGLGAQPPAAELGALINVGRRYLLDQWWCSVFPGIAIVLAVLAFNLIGDGLRDLLDPKAARRSLVR
jgi:peptide/nickel transport system permease protein